MEGGATILCGLNVKLFIFVEMVFWFARPENMRFAIRMSEPIETPLNEARFQGTQHGTLKTLQGFQKGFSLPDSPGEYADRTARRLGAQDLVDHAESLFQTLKTTFNYKRRELSLGHDADAGAASIDAPNYRVDITIKGDPENASNFHLVTKLCDITDPDVARSEDFATAFDGLFDRLCFDFPAPLNVEDVIDRVEDLENDSITVTYPSDASECTVVVEGHSAKLHFEPGGLMLLAPHRTNVASLLEASEQVPAMFG